ncbi:acyltransferase, partial [Neisseria meningitidis]
MSQTLPYRPDIDTLRAAAVLSVIVFHIEKNWLPGGFLGVDIFFVISGFLMTMILHRE